MLLYEFLGFDYYFCWVCLFMLFIFNKSFYLNNEIKKYLLIYSVYGMLDILLEQWVFINIFLFGVGLGIFKFYYCFNEVNIIIVIFILQKGS